MKFIKLLGEAQFHGAKLLTDHKHRNYWLTALTCLLLAATWTLIAMIFRFMERPIFYTRNRTPNYRMEFPSLRVCPEVKFPEHRMEAFLDKVHIPPSYNRSHIREILPQLAAFQALDLPYTTKDLVVLEKVLAANNMTVNEASEFLTASCEESLLRCRWKGQLSNCSQLFRMELTGIGFCCVFNGRSLYREIKEHGRHRGVIKPHLFNKRVGPLRALVVALNQSQILKNVDLDYKWVSVQQGFTFADTVTNGSAMVPGREYWLGYDASGFQLNSEAKVLGSSIIKCRKMYAEPLEHFPVYRREYCLLECEMRQMMHQCGCVRPQFPTFPGYRHCNARQLYCMRHAGLSWLDCNCPRTCTVNNFRNIVASYPLFQSSPTIDQFYHGLNLSRISVVRLFHISYLSSMYERRSYFSILDLFSQFGGIFNVYFGCSVLTLFEILMLMKYWKSSSDKNYNIVTSKIDRKSKVINIIGKKHVTIRSRIF